MPSERPRKRKRYVIWFDQINQMMVEISAETEEKAIEAARRFGSSRTASRA